MFNLNSFKSWLGQLIFDILLSVGFPTIKGNVESWASGGAVPNANKWADKTQNEFLNDYVTGGSNKLISDLDTEIQGVNNDITTLKGGSSKTISQLETDIANAQLGAVQSFVGITGVQAYSHADATGDGFVGNPAVYDNGADAVYLLSAETAPPTAGKHQYYLDETAYAGLAKDSAGRVRFFHEDFPTVVYDIDENDLIEIIGNQGGAMTSVRVIRKANVQEIALSAQDSTDTVDAFTAAWTAHHNV